MKADKSIQRVSGMPAGNRRGRKELILHIWFAFIMFYVCFKHLFVNDNFLYVILDVLFLIVILKGIYEKVRIKMNAGWCFYMILVIDMLFSVFYADSFVDAVKFTIIYIHLVVIAFWFTQIKGWQPVYYQWMKAGCLFHLGFTLFSVIFTEQALQISSKFLTSEAQNLTVLWQQCHLYAGISGQTGTNAFFFVVLIGLFLSELYISCRCRALTGALFFSSCLGLLLTGKKGLMIAAAFAVLAVLWLAGDRIQKKTVLLFVSMGLFAVLFIWTVVPEKIYQLFYVSVVSRMRILDGVLEGIRQRPVFGNGVNSVGNFTYKGNLGHNIYLQMWLEQGMTGLGILLAAFFSCFYVTYRRMKKSEVVGKKCQSYYFSLFIQVFIIVNGFMENTIYNYNMALVYFLAIAAGFAAGSQEKIRIGEAVQCVE